MSISNITSCYWLQVLRDDAKRRDYDLARRLGASPTASPSDFSPADFSTKWQPGSDGFDEFFERWMHQHGSAVLLCDAVGAFSKSNDLAWTNLGCQESIEGPDDNTPPNRT